MRAAPGHCVERGGASEQGGGQPHGTWSQRTAPLPPPPVAMELTLVFRREKVVPGQFYKQQKMSYQLRKCCLYINIRKSQVAKSGNQERKSAKGERYHRRWLLSSPRLGSYLLPACVSPLILVPPHKEWRPSLGPLGHYAVPLLLRSVH